MCSQDMLFFINTFGFTYDPRLTPNSTVILFITYLFQDVALDEIKEAIEVGFDELTEKSRDMGASWMYLTVFVWFWMFRPYNSFRMISRNEDLVDKSDDPDSLFWKVMFLIDHLPSWMRPQHRKVHLNLKNEDNGSNIGGCTTTSDAARGGRCTAMLPDEFAAVPDGRGILHATRDVTTCRLFNSTHRGIATAFYSLSKGKIRKLILHWSLHPVKSRGLYYAKDGELILLDKDFKGKVIVGGETFDFPDEYPFRLDGKLRSPFYDNECDRAEHPMEIAQELDMDPFASDFQYFDGEMIDKIEKDYVKLPYSEGELEFDESSCDPIEFIEGSGGRLRLWINLDAYGNLPEGLQVGAGADISAGTGASNSAISFVNLKTGEKIAEYVNPGIKPAEFAKLSVALCKWFSNAYLVFDGAGYGRVYADTIIDKTDFRNIYYRRNEKSIDKTISTIPGVFLNPEEKKSVIGAYRRALKDGVFIQRSSEANQECLSYIYTIGNKVVHSSSTNNVDPSGAGDSHGDRVIADALANKALNLLAEKEKEAEKVVPDNCWAARRKRYEAKQKKGKEW